MILMELVKAKVLVKGGLTKSLEFSSFFRAVDSRQFSKFFILKKDVHFFRGTYDKMQQIETYARSRK